MRKLPRLLPQQGCPDKLIFGQPTQSDAAEDPFLLQRAGESPVDADTPQQVAQRRRRTTRGAMAAGGSQKARFW